MSIFCARGALEVHATVLVSYSFVRVQAVTAPFDFWGASLKRQIVKERVINKRKLLFCRLESGSYTLVVER